MDFNRLAQDIKQWGQELGFQQIGISDTVLQDAEERLAQWLRKKFHGDMKYMAHHGLKRCRPAALVPGTLRIITARMNYLPPTVTESVAVLKQSNLAYISRYALGRDYHKLIRKRLQRLATRINEVCPELKYRCFADSGPVMEKPLAEKAGLGWIGKHTNLINSKQGSWFFLGTLFTNLPLPVDAPSSQHCGSCQACIAICPTKAIIGPYQLDARKCISYLTIEYRGVIPIELRPLLGNRIYGCDDCQLVCPWNRFAKLTQEKDFHPRHGLDAKTLLELFQWTESDFLTKTEGSAIKRIGYACWLRNVAIALGNASFDPHIIQALTDKLTYPSNLVVEHVRWALDVQLKRGGC